MPEQQEVLTSSTEIGGEQTPVLSVQDVPAKEPEEMDDPLKDQTESEDDQDILDDLGEIEFLLDEIEDQIAPLAL